MSVVLIAEEDPARPISGALQHEGYTCVSADGEDALLKALASERPDLLVLNGANAWRLLRLVRLRIGPEIRVVVVSAAYEAAAALGATFYVPKPFRPASLVAAVAGSLSRSRGGSGRT